MSIDKNKTYKVRRFATGSEAKKMMNADLGNLKGSDLKPLLRGYKYDPEYDLWFSKSFLVGYSTVEVSC